MPDLKFKVLTAEPEPFAVGPLLRFKLHVSQSAAAGAKLVPIHAVALQCQIRIDPARRQYATAEQEKLLDLFDRPSRWGQTLRPMLWTHASVGIGPFTDSIVVDLPVPCTYDFNVAVTKYFYALEDGEIPVNLLFSGTVFHEGEDGALQVAQIPWDRESVFRLRVSVWKEMMEQYYPNSAWLCLRKDVFDRLYRYKSRHGLPTWEQALESLLQTPENGCPPAGALRRNLENSVS
jgi:Family of unknown function (DUF6084)